MANLNLWVLLTVFGLSQAAPADFRDLASTNNKYGLKTQSSETDVKGPKRTDGLGAFDSESEFYFNGRRTKPSNGAYPFPNGAGFPIPGFNINSRYPYFNPVGERGPGYGAFGNPTKFGGSSSASSAASQSFSNGGFSGSSSNAASQSFSNGGSSGSSSNAASQSFSTDGFSGSASQASSASNSFCSPGFGSSRNNRK